MRQEEKEYYESEDSSFKMDLHYGKIKIYEVPFEYRTRNAYLYAHEYTLAVYDGSEKAKRKKLDLELLKHQLLDDIIENEKRGLTGRAESLRGFYDSYIFYYPVLYHVVLYHLFPAWHVRLHFVPHSV